MKLPLLLYFTPRVGTGPTVMLASGKWKIESNHKDSELGIALTSIGHSPIDIELELSKDTAAQISITKAGSEKELTVYAVRQ